MPDNTSFDRIMSDLRDGDSRAAGEVFRRFVHRVIGLARTNLDTRLRGKEDPEDVQQSVFKSFFRAYQHGRLELGGWDALWAILVVLTLRKCGHRAEHWHAAKRDIRREQTPAAAPDTSAIDWTPIDRDPRPEEGAMLADLVSLLMRPLKDIDRPILTLALQGHPLPEISTQVGRSERTLGPRESIGGGCANADPAFGGCHSIAA